MTVAELISKLQEMPQEYNVNIAEDATVSWGEVDEVEQGVNCVYIISERMSH